MRSARNCVYLVIGLAVALTLNVACGPYGGSDDRMNEGAAEGELRAVELPISYSAVTHVAKEKGYIGDEGLDYRVISVPAGPDIISGLRAGGGRSADVGSIAVTPIIVMIGAGDHPVVLATGIESNMRVQLVTFANSGITEDPRTLEEKRVGFVGSTVGEIYLSRLLETVGMTEQDIRSVDGRPADLKSLLLRGDLDAAVLWDPFVAQAQREGRKRMKNDRTWERGEPQVYVDPSLYNLTFNIVAMRSKVEEKRPQIIRFLKACVKAGDFIEEHPDEAQGMLEGWLNLKPGDLSHFMETTSFRVHLDVPQMKEDMRGELQWLRKRAPSTVIPEDLSDFIDPSLLAEIDADRVAIAQ